MRTAPLLADFTQLRDLHTNLRINLDGTIKAELYLDFDLENAEDVPKLLEDYVYYFNHKRPAAALGYKSPVQYKTELAF